MFNISFTAALVVVIGGSALAAEGDVESGRKLYAQCRACHETDAGRHKVGPSLHDIFGRTAGTVEGFRYSPALTQSGIVWDERNLSQYLADPREFIKGNRMAYAGLKDEKQRADVIAFLKQATRK